MKSVSQIPKIKDQMWLLLQYYLKQFTKSFTLFKSTPGKEFSKLIRKNESINKYQWKVKEPRVSYCLLEQVYLKNFLISFYHLTINGVEKFKRPDIFSKEFLDSRELKEYFNVQFQKLEEKILLNDEFEYKLLIPTFRIYFPDGVNTIELDSDHLIRNIYGQENIYGDHYSISKFKEPPGYWEPFGESRSPFKEANASIEVFYRIKKKISSEPPYSSKFVPYAPFLPHEEYGVFREKVKSIHNFFTCYSQKYEFLPFTYGIHYFIELPPFSQNYP